MGDIDISSFKNLYLETAKQYITTLETSLSQLGSEKEKAALESAYISAHSLRSQSQVMGYSFFSALSAELEKIFRSAKEGQLSISAPLTSVLYSAVQNLKQALLTSESGGVDIDHSAIIQELMKNSGTQEAGGSQ